MTNAFNGFTPDSLAFLESLGRNNNKAWFEAYRQDFENYLMTPLKALVTDLAAPMLAIDSDFVIIPAVDKTISRIYRDTRFSHDKSPYKTCLWITFKRNCPDWKDSPCYFFELTADSYRYGMGFYSASKETMNNIRELIDSKQAKFQKAISFLDNQQTFKLGGECYKRLLKPTLPDSLQEWYQRKSVHLVSKHDVGSQLFSRKIFNELSEGYTLLSPLYHFLWEIKG
jgi:uncharacterized protein (TIGR02453 family)